MVINMWALIQNGTVAEITDLDPKGRFHPYLVWVEVDSSVEPGWQYKDGEFSPPEPESLPVSEQVTRAQGKAALITAGLWSDVLAYVEAMTDPIEKALAEVALHDTTHWRRDSPTMLAIATALGVTGEQMDDLFINAAQIQL